MATPELQVINSVLKNKDIGILFKENVDDLFTAYSDVWVSIKNYYGKYGTVPDIEVMQSTFNDLEDVSVKGESQYYLDELRATFIKNKIARLLDKASDKLSVPTAEIVLNGMMADLSQLTKYSHSARDLNVMDFEAAEKHFAEVRAKAEAMGGTPGIPTGISFIDASYTSGLAGGDLVILFGWTGRGKSQVSTLMMANAFMHGHKPMYVSLEMSEDKMRDRIYTILGSGTFRHSDLSLGIVNDDDFRSFKSKFSDGRDFTVVTNDGISELTPNVMQGKIEQHRPSALVFDYAQLGSDNEYSQDMTARMRNMSKQYKRLAVRNDIPIILISSATPESSSSANTPPIIEQVAWSKQLAFDADLAIAVHKHDDSNIMELVCRKNRNGELFSGYLDWDINRGIVEEVFELPE